MAGWTGAAAKEAAGALAAGAGGETGAGGTGRTGGTAAARAAGGAEPDKMSIKAGTTGGADRLPPKVVTLVEPENV